MRMEHEQLPTYLRKAKIPMIVPLSVLPTNRVINNLSEGCVSRFETFVSGEDEGTHRRNQTDRTCWRLHCVSGWPSKNTEE